MAFEKLLKSQRFLQKVNLDTSTRTTFALKKHPSVINRACASMNIEANDYCITRVLICPWAHPHQQRPK